MGPIFSTLGPEGTCHDNALKHFIAYQKIDHARIVYTMDFFLSAKELIKGKIDFIVQNVAHPQVAELSPRFRDKLFVVDTFIFPTIDMGILCNKKIADTKTFGLMPATTGYINKEKWGELVYEISNPIVASELLKGKYKYGLTFVHYAKSHSDILEVVEDFGGAIDTAWIVYGRNKKFNGKVLGTLQPEFYNNEFDHEK